MDFNLFGALGPLDAESARAIVQDYLQDFGKTLEHSHVEALIEPPQSLEPLYLTAVLAEIRTLGGNDLDRIVPQVVSRIGLTCPDVASLFGWVLERQEALGLEHLRWWTSYLAVARAGMPPRDLQQLLIRKLGSRAGAAARRIERSFRQHLAHEGGRVTFHHREILTAIRQRYGADEKEAHGDIGRYFAQCWPSNRCAQSQLVYHLLSAELFDDLYQTLTSFDFIEARCGGGDRADVVDSAFELLRDYTLALAAWPAHRNVERGVLTVFEQTIKTEHGKWAARPHLAFQQMYPHLQWAGEAIGGALRRLCAAHAPTYTSRRPWLRRTNQPSTAASLHSRVRLDTETVSVLLFTGPDRLVAGTGDGRFYSIGLGVGGNAESAQLTLDLFKVVALGVQDAEGEVWALSQSGALWAVNVTTGQVRGLASLPGEVTSGVVERDGRVAAGTRFGQVVLWSSSGSQTFAARRSRVDCVVLGPSPADVCAVVDSGKVWRFGRTSGLLKSGSGRVRKLLRSPDGGLWLIGVGGSCEYLPSGAKTPSVRGCLDTEVDVVALSPSGRRLAAGTGKPGLLIAEVGDRVKRLGGSHLGGRPTAVAITDDDRMCAVALSGGEVEVHLVDRIGESEDLPMPASAPACLRDGEREQEIVYLDVLGFLRVLDPRSGRVARSSERAVPGDCLWSSGAPVSPRVVVTSTAGALGWDARRLRPMKLIADELGGRTAAVSPDGQMFVRGGAGGVVQGFHLETGVPLFRCHVSDRTIVALCMARDRTLLALDEGGSLAAHALVPDERSSPRRLILSGAFPAGIDRGMLNPLTLETRWRVPVGASAHIGCGAGSRLVAVAGRDGLLVVREDDGERQLSIETGGSVDHVAFSVGGDRLATVIDGHRCVVWCARTGATLGCFVLGSAAKGIAWGGDGRWLAMTSTADRVVIVALEPV